MTGFDFSAYEHLDIAVFGVDVASDGVPRYCYANSAAVATTGFCLEEIDKRTALDVHRGRAGEIAYQRHLTAIASKEAVTYLLDVTVGERARLIRTTLSPVQGPSGKVACLVGSAVEVGQDRGSGPLATPAERLQNEVEHFIALAAHDLRTPMRNVQIIAEMLREDIPEDCAGSRELIDLLDDVAAKSSDLIADVLNHALAGATSSDTLPFDFDALCRNTTGVLDPQKNHVVHWPKAAVRADKTAVQIVLRNLLDNAFKHGNRERMTVDISLRPLSAGMVEFAVEDNGAGFENPGKAVLESSALGGAGGFGLMGIRRLITSRGGTIRFDKRADGTGCLVRFRLPGSVAVRDLVRRDVAKRV